MATKVRNKTSQKQVVRMRRKLRVFSRIRRESSDRPRLTVFRSNAHLYAQLIDDNKGHTLASASTQEEELRGKVKLTREGARQVGLLLAKRALAKNVNEVVFDRSGYLYHGRVKALADGAREGGLKF